MHTILDTRTAPRRAVSKPKRKVAKPFKLEPRDADLAEYKVSTQRALVALRNLYRD